MSCVFERGVGFREREVETGWSFDGRVKKRKKEKKGAKTYLGGNRKKKKSFLTEKSSHLVSAQEVQEGGQL